MKINPTIGGSLISGAASLLGGLFGSSSSDKAAKAQLQAVRETNSLNKELAYQQNEWNLQQWTGHYKHSDDSIAANSIHFADKPTLYLKH